MWYSVRIGFPTICGTGWVALAIILDALTQPVLADTYLKCSTKEVVFTDKPHGETSSTKKLNLVFRVNDAAKTIKFLDNTALTVTRFDRFWISAEHGDVSYELNRQDAVLSYASSTMRDGVTTTIVGSGQCKDVSTPYKK